MTKKQNKQKYHPGDVLSLRLPSNFTSEELEGLNHLKFKLDRDFNKVVAPLLLKSIDAYMQEEKKEITVPLPKKLTVEQEANFNNPLVKQLIGQLVYQLILNPAQPIDVDMISQNNTIPTKEPGNEPTHFKNSFGANFINNNFDFDDDE